MILNSRADVIHRGRKGIPRKNIDVDGWKTAIPKSLNKGSVTQRTYEVVRTNDFAAPEKAHQSEIRKTINTSFGENTSNINTANWNASEANARSNMADSSDRTTVVDRNVPFHDRSNTATIGNGYSKDDKPSWNGYQSISKQETRSSTQLPLPVYNNGEDRMRFMESSTVNQDVNSGKGAAPGMMIDAPGDRRDGGWMKGEGGRAGHRYDEYYSGGYRPMQRTGSENYFPMQSTVPGRMNDYYPSYTEGRMEPYPNRPDFPERRYTPEYRYEVERQRQDLYPPVWSRSMGFERNLPPPPPPPPMREEFVVRRMDDIDWEYSHPFRGKWEGMEARKPLNPYDDRSGRTTGDFRRSDYIDAPMARWNDPRLTREEWERVTSSARVTDPIPRQREDYYRYGGSNVEGYPGRSAGVPDERRFESPRENGNAWRYDDRSVVQSGPQAPPYGKEDWNRTRTAEPHVSTYGKEDWNRTRTAEPQVSTYGKEDWNRTRTAEPHVSTYGKEDWNRMRTAEPQVSTYGEVGDWNRNVEPQVSKSGKEIWNRTTRTVGTMPPSYGMADWDRTSTDDINMRTRVLDGKDEEFRRSSDRIKRTERRKTDVLTVPSNLFDKSSGASERKMFDGGSRSQSYGDKSRSELSTDDMPFIAKLQSELESQRLNWKGEIDRLSFDTLNLSPPNADGGLSPVEASQNTFVDTSSVIPIFTAFVDLKEFSPSSISVNVDKMSSKIVVEANEEAAGGFAKTFTQKIQLPRFADDTNLKARVNSGGVLKIQVPLLFYFPEQEQKKAASGDETKSFVYEVRTNNEDGSKVIEILVKPGRSVSLDDLRVETLPGKLIILVLKPSESGNQERTVVKTYTLPPMADTGGIVSRRGNDGCLTVLVPIRNA